MKIIITILRGFSDKFGEFQIKSTKIKSKQGEREIKPIITKATGGPVPPVPVEKNKQ